MYTMKLKLKEYELIVNFLHLACQYLSSHWVIPKQVQSHSRLIQQCSTYLHLKINMIDVTLYSIVLIKNQPVLKASNSSWQMLKYFTCKLEIISQAISIDKKQAPNVIQLVHFMYINLKLRTFCHWSDSNVLLRSAKELYLYDWLISTY